MAKVGIPFLIKIESSLHLGQASMGEGEYLFTQRHVPGSALRGALAEVLIKKWDMDPESDDFIQIFDGDKAVRFEPAYPATPEFWGYPFPLTARRCKISGGFPLPDVPSWERENYHGAFDILASQFVFEEQTAALTSGGTPLPFIERPRCPHSGCWESVEPAPEGYVWDSSRERPMAPPKMNIVRHTHTAINRARGVAEDGMLYTVETIEPGALLRGCFWVEKEKAQQVRDALQDITRLGRGASRGRGRVAVEALDGAPLDGTRERIQALTESINAERDFYAQLTGRTTPPEDGYYFTLDLLSPAIFGDGVTATLIPDDLCLQGEVTLERRFATPKTVGGWWSAAKLPHPTALAIAAGSVFLYHASGDIDLDDLSDKLDTVRAEGIGRRRERGYGAVMPCAPFHLWTAEKEAKR